MMLRLEVARRHRIPLRSNSMVVAQVWRDDRGRQTTLARALSAVRVDEIDQATGRSAGVLLGRAKTSDAVDATVALLAQDGDTVLTSDVTDLKKLLAAAECKARVVRC